MTDREQYVTDAMHQHANSLTIPVPPIEELVHDGQRARGLRRRRALVAAAAVLVGALVVAPWALGLDDDHADPVRPVPSPSPSQTPTKAHALADLPEGTAPKTAYLEGGVLHHDGRQVATKGNRIVAAGDTVLVGRGRDRDAQWWQLVGDSLEPQPALDGVVAPYLSPTGDLVAWTSYPDTRTTRVTAWDPAQHSEIAHVDLDAPFAECCGGGQEVEIYGIDGHGLVYWSKAPGVTVWRPRSGGQVVRLTGADSLGQIAPIGPTAQADGTGLLGQVDDQGQWSKVAELPTDQSATWSPDGVLMAYGADDHGDVLFKQTPTDEWVLDVTTGEKTRLDVPAGTRTNAIAFESDEALLVDAFTDPRVHYVLRCSTSDGRCERALAPGPISRWAFPSLLP